MLTVLSIMMFIVPALFSVVIHNYLRHGELSGKRKTVDISDGYAIFKGARFCIKCGNPISEEICAVEGHFAVDNIENKI